MKKLAAIGVGVLLLVPAVAFGQIVNPLGPNVTFSSLLIRFTNWLLGIIAILGLLGVVWGGIRMIAALGNDQALAASKKIVMWSVAGLALAIISYLIISVVIDVFGVI